MALSAAKLQLLADGAGYGFAAGPRSPFDIVLEASNVVRLSDSKTVKKFFSVNGYRLVIDGGVHRESPARLLLPSASASVLNDDFGREDADGVVELDQFKTGALEVGEVRVAVPDGGLDGAGVDLATGYAWGGADGVLKLVGMDEAWTGAEALFPFKFVDDPEGDEDELVFQIKAAAANLNAPNATDTFSGAGDTRGYVFGRALGVELYPRDPANLIYSADDEAIEGFPAVYENGFPVGSALTEDLANGELTLSNWPQGRITADVKGQKFDGGAYSEERGKIFEELSTRLGFAGLNSTDRAAQTDAVGVVIPAKSGGRLGELLDFCARPLAFPYPAQDGSEWRLASIVDPSGEAAVESYREDENDIVSIETFSPSPPAWKVRVGYGLNWTKLDDPHVNPDDPDLAARLARDFQWKEAEDASIKTDFANAVFLSLRSPLADAAAAATAATNALAIFKVSRRVFRIKLAQKLFSSWIGDVVTLQHSRYGLTAGKKVLVVGVSLDLSLPEVSLHLWG